MTLFKQIFAAFLGFVTTSGLAFAQGYPTKPITLVVPFAAGSGTDAVARAVAQKLADQLKQTVLVDNKPGASAQLGAMQVAKAKPDGYTLLMTTNTSHSANPSLFQNLKYDPIRFRCDHKGRGVTVRIGHQPCSTR
jgi:tripartite-type tricarboxylate transporter receptor subunit TctC